MCIKKFAAVILTAVIFAGCTAQTAEEENIPQEEKKRAAIASWFAESMTDEEAIEITRYEQTAPPRTATAFTFIKKYGKIGI